MSQADVDVVLDQFEATNERDFERAMSLYAEDVQMVVHRDAFLDAGNFEGREAVGRFFGNWFTTFEPGYRLQIEEARDLDTCVFLEVSHHGRGRSSGAEITGRTGYLYEVRDGKVVRAELFGSRAQALEAAGAED